jgi:hypothetical protein
VFPGLRPQVPLGLLQGAVRGSGGEAA